VIFSIAINVLFYNVLRVIPRLPQRRKPGSLCYGARSAHRPPAASLGPRRSPKMLGSGSVSFRREAESPLRSAIPKDRQPDLRRSENKNKISRFENRSRKGTRSVSSRPHTHTTILILWPPKHILRRWHGHDPESLTIKGIPSNRFRIGVRNEENVVGVECAKRKSEVSETHRASHPYDGSAVMRSGITVDPASLPAK